MKYMIILMGMYFMQKSFYFIFFLIMFVLFFLVEVMNKSFYFHMMDSYSSMLSILSIWLLFMMYLLIKNNLLLEKKSFFLFYILFSLLLCLMLSFLMKSFFLFYIFFELSVIPTFLLILGWGYSIERLQAGLYMMLYTIFFSLPFLFLNFKFFHENMSLDMTYSSYFFKNKNLLMWSFWGIMVFLVKLPMFLIHLWLPKAHVEAPLIGSMILAGILLKLGGYGLIRIFYFSFFYIPIFSSYLISISIFGGVIVGINCLRQVDLKMLIAYSSVSHMGMVLASLLSTLKMGLKGSFLMMLSHGLSSSGLFMGLGLIYYRLSSRSVLILKGSFFVTPIFFFFWFLLCSLNLSFPPSLNFFSEIFMMFAILNSNLMILFFLIMMMFITGIYSIYLYISMGHSLNSMKTFLINFFMMDYMVFFMHIYPLFIYILFL